ncbi:MAG: serine hydrolase [Acidimicrobiaceae bacterium]|nr:serine hydrolase [Acidimicrobiaceae bacterium]
MEDGLLDLDERAFDILDHIEPVGGKIIDPRYREVTVRQLLHHSGARAGGDYMVNPLVVDRPTDCTDVIRYALGVLPLESDPGTKYSYSNFGYCILGRIIEEKSGQPYEDYVKKRVLASVGITRMQIGRTLLKDRVDGEVRYYWSPRHRLWDSDYPDGPRGLPPQYGGIFLPRYDAAGGWLGSTIDLLRFVTSLDGTRPPAILEADTVELMLSRHDPPLTSTARYYAMGWQVTPATNGNIWQHSGSFWGAHARLLRRYDGLAVAMQFNSGNDDSRAYSIAANELLWEGIRNLGTLPNHDLFPLFGFE